MVMELRLLVYFYPIGKAKIEREGKDVTITAFSKMVGYALQATEILAKEGISAEVINLHSIRPIDRGTINASIKKTNRLVTVEEGFPQHGVGAEICIVGSLGVPILNGSAPSQQAAGFLFGGQVGVSSQTLQAQVVASQAFEPVGSPSECLILKNMFDPVSEMEPDFDLDIKEEVEEECSSFGQVKHTFVDKNTAGFVYLRFGSVEAAVKAQQAMHKRWYARRLISALFMDCVLRDYTVVDYFGYFAWRLFIRGDEALGVGVLAL